jgi:hypothetical protein
MQNAKLVREKTQGRASEEPTAETAAKGLHKDVQELLYKYVYKLQGAFLNAQLRQTQATYDYLENLQSAAKAFGDPAGREHVEELKISAEQQNAQKYGEAQRKYWEFVRNAYLDSQKNVERAVTEHYQSLHQIWDEYQKDLGEKNDALAQALKETIAKSDMTSVDIPLLAAVYYATATAPSGSHKPQK